MDDRRGPSLRSG